MKLFDKVTLSKKVVKKYDLFSNEAVIVDFLDFVDEDSGNLIHTAKLVDKDLNAFTVLKCEVDGSDFRTKELKVIKLLKQMQVDGETMQHILDEVGMSEQMLTQLVKTFGLDRVGEIDVDNDTFDHRAEMIQDDVAMIRELISGTPLCDEFIDKVFTCLNNIEICTDWNSKESVTWTKYSKNVKK